ncbi:NAD(P)H-hydrate repair Nnr-like enzyme with NAD(P)H-hydrate dehydratase domain [Mycetocola sp. BIGb0189]|uniref:ADP-dependent NAD(P)H-hydrate dehydratase n=1 Tax=Mycetocola sp. BIGb0189 TaxID=2940604 RepID=UPI00216711AE|nr:ADP/ATP-dependent (S)-NAD(P)H-hydrate dehydratase [Mycetocola sp. BIGb0189]MCS4276258.1 NAD(P)H-hydrate repair Nnr-like enzyme with NAD(P)H-hydrate dehydratase domain [Mycetocola sp. BIGb0189]
MTETGIPWHLADTREQIRIPTAADDKYRRGVLGIRTGSVRYPGAAVLGVEAALHTGVGMVRYVGPDSVGHAVLARRPETVLGSGRVQALLIGSGMEPLDPEGTDARALAEAVEAGIPSILDAGAIGLVAHHPGARILLTPHAGELAGLFRDHPDERRHEGIPTTQAGLRSWIEAHPELAASCAAERWGVSVLLKGAHTVAAAPGEAALLLPPATPWLASAGTGDVLAGAIGALAASAGRNASLARIAAAGAHLHALAAKRASAGGPLLALELAHALAPTVADVLRG